VDITLGRAVRFVALTAWVIASYIAANLILRAIVHNESAPISHVEVEHPSSELPQSPVNVQVNPVTVGTETREIQTPTIQVGNAAEPQGNGQ
jgi:hypothetical protein